MIERSATDSTVRLEGDVGISAAIELRDNLIEAMSSGSDFKVELIGVAALDITTLQLLWAAERAAAIAGTKLILSGAIPAELNRAIELAGLEVFAVSR